MEPVLAEAVAGVGDVARERVVADPAAEPVVARPPLHGVVAVAAADAVVAGARVNRVVAPSARTRSFPPNAWITSASGVPLSRSGPSSPSIVAATAVAVSAPAAASVATRWTGTRLLHLGTGPTSWLYG